MIDQENMIETEVAKQASLDSKVSQFSASSLMNKIGDRDNISQETELSDNIESPISAQSLKTNKLQVPFAILDELGITKKQSGVWVQIKRKKVCKVLGKYESESADAKCLKDELSEIDIDDIYLKFGQKTGKNVTMNVSIKDESGFFVDGLQLPNQIMEAVIKYPKQWKCLGSEKEVRLGQVENTRPLINLEMENGNSKNMRRPLQLSERLEDSTSSYVSLGPGTRAIPGALRETLDMGVQAVPRVKTASAQMEPGLPINAWTQYIYDLEGTDEVETTLSKELPPDYKFNEEQYLNNALEYNETFNLYTNDYPLLVKDAQESVIPQQAAFTPMDALIDVKYVAGLVVVMIAWNPLREGVLAVLYASSTNSQLYEEPHTSSDRNSVLLIWDLKDPLEPKLKLECPKDVVVMRWCQVDQYLIVGGSVSGQVIIWDLTGRLDEIESTVDMSETRQRIRKILLNTLDWSAIQLGSINVEPSALSSLAHSHEGEVSDLYWLTPYFAIDSGGHYKPLVNEEFSLQFISCGKDGVFLIWDLRNVPAESIKLERMRKKNNIDDRRRFRTFNRIFLPLFKIMPQIPESKKIFNIVTMALPCYSVNYEKVERANDSGTEDNQNREWCVLKPCETYAVDELKIPDRTIWFSTEDGLLGLVSWEGFAFEKGEEVTCEFVDIVSICSSIHDGPIVRTLISPFIPNLLLTVGGHIIALWMQDKPESPILTRRLSCRITSAAWSRVRPSLFRVTRTDGTLEVWDFLYRSDRPVIKQSISGDPLTALSNNPFTLPDGQRIVAVGDYKNALHLFYNPPQFQNIGPDDLIKMLHFIERETELNRRYEVWNSSFKTLYKPPKAIDENQTKVTAPVVKQEVADEKKVLKKRMKRVDEQTARDEQIMLTILMRKKNLNKSDLLAKQQPIRLVQQRAEEKRIKTELKIKKQEVEFEKAVASILPELESGQVRECYIDENLKDEILASLQEVMDDWREKQGDILTPIESEPRVLESDKVLEEGMTRRLAVDIALFSRKKRQERFLSRLDLWEESPPSPLGSLELAESSSLEIKTSLALCNSLDGEEN